MEGTGRAEQDDRHVACRAGGGEERSDASSDDRETTLVYQGSDRSDSPEMSRRARLHTVSGSENLTKPQSALLGEELSAGGALRRSKSNPTIFSEVCVRWICQKGATLDGVQTGNHVSQVCKVAFLRGRVGFASSARCVYRPAVTCVSVCAMRAIIRDCAVQ